MYRSQSPCHAAQANPLTVGACTAALSFSCAAVRDSTRAPAAGRGALSQGKDCRGAILFFFFFRFFLCVSPGRIRPPAFGNALARSSAWFVAQVKLCRAIDSSDVLYGVLRLPSAPGAPFTTPPVASSINPRSETAGCTLRVEDRVAVPSTFVGSHRSASWRSARPSWIWSVRDKSERLDSCRGFPCCKMAVPCLRPPWNPWSRISRPSRTFAQDLTN